MPNVAEILISARQDFLKATQQAKRELQDLGKSGEESGRKIETGGHAAHKSMAEARETARGLSEVIGVHLPKSVVQFLAHSQSIGPILAGAFSTIAVVQMIQVLGELPEAFNKIVGAITGWDEKAKKAYDHFLEENQKALEAVEKVRRAQIDLLDVSEAGKVGLVVGGLQEQLAVQNKIIAKTQEELNLWEKFKELPPEATAGTGLMPVPSESVDELNKRLTSAKEAAEKLRKEISEKTNIDMPKALNEETKKLGEEFDKARTELIALHKEYKSWSASRLQDFRSRGGAADDIKAGLVVADMTAKKIIESYKELLKLEDEAGAAFIQNQSYWDKQLLDFRNRTAGGGEDVKAGETAADITAKANIKRWEETKKQSEEFIRSFREGAGKVWDDFFISGKHILTSLADIARALFNQIGRTIFQNFATGLFTGSKQGAGGGIGGAIGSVGAGIGTKMGLSALFGGGSAAAVSGSLATGAVGIINPGTGALVTGTSAGGAASLTTAMTAFATNPITIGVAAAIGSALIIRHFLKHKTQEAAFTTDPYTNRPERTFFFNTNPFGARGLEGGGSAGDRLSDGIDRLNRNLETLEGVPADSFLKKKMIGLYATDNEFRRTSAGKLADELT